MCRKKGALSSSLFLFRAGCIAPAYQILAMIFCANKNRHKAQYVCNIEWLDIMDPPFLLLLLLLLLLVFLVSLPPHNIMCVWPKSLFPSLLTVFILPPLQNKFRVGVYLRENVICTLMKKKNCWVFLVRAGHLLAMFLVLYGHIIQV